MIWASIFHGCRCNSNEAYLQINIDFLKENWLRKKLYFFPFNSTQSGKIFSEASFEICVVVGIKDFKLDHFYTVHDSRDSRKSSWQMMTECYFYEERTSELDVINKTYPHNMKTTCFHPRIRIICEIIGLSALVGISVTPELPNLPM